MDRRALIVSGAVRARLFLTSLLATALVAVPLAGATSSPPQPLTVQSSALTQAGQQLVWTLTLTQPFSPSALQADGRSLCLALLRPESLKLSGRLCVAGPRPGHRSPRLVYQQINATGVAPGRTITATVTRAGPRDLTASFAPQSVGMTYRSLRWQMISALDPPACTPTPATPDACVNAYPAKPALARLHTPQLVGCVPSGAPFINKGPATRRVVALTFDDGPWYDTAQFLTILERYHVPATFFEIGEQISTYGHGGAIERRMLADGDMIGDHTWSHPNVAGGGAFAAGQIRSTAAAIKQATHGFQPCLFRAPYGAVSPALISVVRSMGMTAIQWDIDPRDWARPGTGAIYNTIVSNAHPGAIILQHDGGGDRSQTLAALPQEIRTLSSRGYRFETVTQLLGQRLIYR